MFESATALGSVPVLCLLTREGTGTGTPGQVSTPPGVPPISGSSGGRAAGIVELQRIAVFDRRNVIGGRSRERAEVSFFWWARQVLNLRPLACEASALPLSYAPGVRKGSNRACRRPEADGKGDGGACPRRAAVHRRASWLGRPVANYAPAPGRAQAPISPSPLRRSTSGAGKSAAVGSIRQPGRKSFGAASWARAGVVR